MNDLTESGTTDESRPAANSRFLCDAMLGSLSRELAKLNWDVEYRRGIGGIQALREARSRDRVLLTRNKRLAKQPGVYVIKAQTMPEQVAELKEAFRPAAAARQEQEPVPAATPRSREGEAVTPAPPTIRPPDRKGLLCPTCNEHLIRITREQARPAVSFLIYQIHHEFGRCAKCKRVYWPGSLERAQATRPAQAASQPGRAKPDGERRRGFGRVFRRPAHRNTGRPNSSGTAGPEQKP